MNKQELQKKMNEINYKLDDITKSLEKIKEEKKVKDLINANNKSIRYAIVNKKGA